MPSCGFVATQKKMNPIVSLWVWATLVSAVHCDPSLSPPEDAQICSEITQKQTQQRAEPSWFYLLNHSGNIRKNPSSQPEGPVHEEEAEHQVRAEA